LYRFGSEINLHIEQLKEKLSQGKLPTDLDWITEISKPAEIFKQIDFVSISETVCLNFVSKILSSASTAVANELIPISLLPRAKALTKPASRLFASTLSVAAQLHPRAVADAFVTPLVLDDSITTSQTELIARTATAIPAAISAFIRVIAQQRSLTWKDPIIALLQQLLSVKNSSLTAETAVELTHAITDRAALCANNSKFAALILAAASKHGTVVCCQ